MNLHCQTRSLGSDAVSKLAPVADQGQARRIAWWPYTGVDLAGQASVGRKGVNFYYSHHFALAPHSLSPMPEQIRALCRRSIVVAPLCLLTAVVFPPLNSLCQQLHHLHLYLLEPLIPHVVPW